MIDKKPFMVKKSLADFKDLALSVRFIKQGEL